jgi:hypothetical protein
MVDGGTGRWTDGRTGGRTAGRTAGRTDGQAPKCTFEGTSAIGNRLKHERERERERERVFVTQASIINDLDFFSHLASIFGNIIKIN